MYNIEYLKLQKDNIDNIFKKINKVKEGNNNSINRDIKVYIKYLNNLVDIIKIYYESKNEDVEEKLLLNEGHSIYIEIYPIRSRLENDNVYLHYNLMYHELRYGKLISELENYVELNNDIDKELFKELIEDVKYYIDNNIKEIDKYNRGYVKHICNVINDIICPSCILKSSLNRIVNIIRMKYGNIIELAEVEEFPSIINTINTFINIINRNIYNQTHYIYQMKIGDSKYINLYSLKKYIGDTINKVIYKYLSENKESLNINSLNDIYKIMILINVEDYQNYVYTIDIVGLELYDEESNDNKNELKYIKYIEDINEYIRDRYGKWSYEVSGILTYFINDLPVKIYEKLSQYIMEI